MKSATWDRTLSVVSAIGFCLGKYLSADDKSNRVAMLLYGNPNGEKRLWKERKNASL
jgi:hypothetical protein